MKRGEGKKEKKRKRKRGRREEEEINQKRYGTTNLEYGTWIFSMDPWFCLVNGLPQT